MIIECARAKTARKSWDLLLRSCWVTLEISTWRISPRMAIWRYLHSHHAVNLNSLFLSLFDYLFKKSPSQFLSHSQFFGANTQIYCMVRIYAKVLRRYERPKMKIDVLQKWCLFYSWQLRKRHHFWQASLFSFSPSYFVLGFFGNLRHSASNH